MSIARGIIKFFGGYTRGDMEDYRAISIKETMSVMAKLKFRVGDQVYINHENYNPSTPYFLLESYNGGNCWYVGKSIDDTTRRELYNGVFTHDISHQAPERCITCHQIITK